MKSSKQMMNWKDTDLTVRQQQQRTVCQFGGSKKCEIMNSIMMAHHFRRWKDSGHSDKLSIRTVFMPRQQNMESVTPSFNKPPIVEVAVCVSFPPIEGFSAANFGLFWQCIRTQFTRFRQMPELPDHIEPAALPVNVSIQTQLVDVPNLRGWYISEDDTEVVQIQNNRFIYNWRRGEGDAAYPRYDKSVRIRFMEEWQRFQDYLQSEGLTISKVHQCELTYVNQIPFGSGWTSLDDLNKVQQFPVTDMGRILFVPV